ncbi:MAG: acetyl-CoA decarbonylase/synthase complex subunit gamma [Eubacteriaceae bacterium]|jgi:acetyl-CoA decarbonylase/synthase complex subunit gamma
MAVKGLDIFKMTPKKNCKECGFPTCMAFSMKVAAGSADISACPHISDDNKAKLSEATAPPMKTITIGKGATETKIGGETVMFRHEKTYVHKSLFAAAVNDQETPAAVDKVFADLETVHYDRIGEDMFAEVVSVRFVEDLDRFVELLNRVKEIGRIPMAVASDKAAAEAAAPILAETGGILVGANKENAAEMAALAAANKIVLGVSGESIEDLHDAVEAVEKAGWKELILNVGTKSIKEAYRNAVDIRTAALKGDDRTFGYPSVVFVNELADGNDQMEVALASMFVLRYGSIIVMNDVDYAKALPLFGLRQNIFTDPQKPMRVETKIYEFNKPDKDAPVLVTVDFALSYFVISGEIERSKVPSYLIIPDAGGYSVLTAWAAGKFGAGTIADAIKNSDIASRTNNKTLILPGKVAVLQGDVQEKLPDWKVVVGPTEALQVPKFLRELTGVA